MVAGRSFVLEDRTHELVARRLNEVGRVVLAAEAAARAGAWVAGFLTYEAGAAFDRSFPIRRPPDGLPLAWFGVFRHRRDVPGVDESAAPDVTVDDLRRIPGSDWYRRGVDTIRSEIEQGNAYQVNLTDRFVGSFAGDAFALYAALARAQRGRYHAFVDLGRWAICSASPELFVEWDDDTATCRPMKGTAPRGNDRATDDDAAADLLASAKDRAENVMIVDLLRNDLSRISEIGSVRVPELFALERYETVWQLTSTVTGRPRPGIELVDLLTATFPCGSITGAPKTAAMRIIDRLEPGPRGVYCGAIGLLAPPGQGPRARFNVAIRTAVVDRTTGTVEYGAGGGITWSSDPRAEDAEADAKARILRTPSPAFALLETMRASAGRVVRAGRHLERLAGAAERFGFPFDHAALETRLRLEAAHHPGDHRVRLLLDRAGRVDLEWSPLGPASAVVALAVPAGRVRGDDRFCRFKTTNRAHYDRLRAEHPAADDVVCVNERDEVAETTIANLLYRWDGAWCTPPLTAGGLPGVGRAALLAAGVVVERLLRLDELAECEALAVVSSLRGVRPAVLVGHRPGNRERGTKPGDPVHADEVDVARRREAAGADRGGIAAFDRVLAADDPEEAFAGRADQDGTSRRP